MLSPPLHLGAEGLMCVDVFLSKYHLNNLASPKRLSSSEDSWMYSDDSVTRISSDDGRDEEFVDVHEIHLDDDDTERWWEDRH